MSKPAMLRCAVYTRKSTEEGLDQAFNTLHAQREACEAYIKSQAGEGWVLRRDPYDDGGFSGAAMDRPALRRLMADVVARRVDVVVVYKVDRLTRSLRDFATIIEAFDAAGVSFVSVTQAFNTTTSMGRLTLNVLLSFAQFEREVTCERIRDKIAASKAKGMWMGGTVPLGYDRPTNQVSRALVVNQGEAETVRLIFQRYLELGNTLLLQRWLQEQGVRSKPRVSSRGVQTGSRPFSRGALRHLLGNRTYLGEIVHKAESYPARHPPIIDRPTFEAAQAILATNSQAKRERVPRSARALLGGLLFDGDGQRMEMVEARRRGGRVYSYYASPPTWVGADHEGDAIRRVPTGAVEELVLRRLAPIAGLVGDALERSDVRAVVARVEVHSANVHVVLRTDALSVHSRQRVTIDGIRRQLLPGEQVTSEPGDRRLLRISLPVRLKLRGGRNWVVGADDADVRPADPPDHVSIQRIRAAHAIVQACGVAPDASSSRLRYARAPISSAKLNVARWAFLAPDIQEAVLNGRRLAAGCGTPSRNARIPLLWSEQRALFGMPEPPQGDQAADRAPSSPPMKSLQWAPNPHSETL